MREPLKDIIRLQHIKEAIERISTFVEGYTEQTLNEDLRTKHAVAYNIQIVGEAVYKLTKEFKTAHQETPWALIEKMRHILVHDYYQVNMQIMWDVITNDLPALKVQVEGYLEE
ncbi:MAG: DUF86 domain-containing protein [Bacteroidaceae bacterium]|nr:DUF86 domain-containing protein [Bacteroidaceae bacterium]